jgi:hypothetical protein
MKTPEKELAKNIRYDNEPEPKKDRQLPKSYKKLVER